MAQTRPRDGKLLAVGHSMGGILLYAMLARCGKFFITCYRLTVTTEMYSADIHCRSSYLWFSKEVSFLQLLQLKCTAGILWKSSYLWSSKKLVFIFFFFCSAVYNIDLLACNGILFAQLIFLFTLDFILVVLVLDPGDA